MLHDEFIFNCTDRKIVPQLKLYDFFKAITAISPVIYSQVQSDMYQLLSCLVT